MADQPSPPAGWQPDPERPDTWRYWDGGAWTDDRAPMGSAGPGWVIRRPVLANAAIIGLAFLTIMVLGSFYNGQIGFALLWLAVLCTLAFVRFRR